jgi:hypothetical protein
MKIRLEVIRSEDCFACRTCCHFGREHAAWAPLFTDEQRGRVRRAFPEEAIRFEPHGALWRIVLREDEAAGALVCPLLDAESGGCRVYDHGIFDCDTWPYEITARDDRLLLTVSPACHLVGPRLDAVRARAEALAPAMLAWIRRYPDNVVPAYEGAIVLADLGPATGGGAA